MESTCRSLELTSRELDIRVLRELITGKEKRWVVEITLNHSASVGDEALTSTPRADARKTDKKS